MESTTEKLLGLISDWTGGYAGAFSIRENGSCAARRSTPHIQIEDKPDAPGLVIFSDYSFLTDQGAYMASKDQYTPWDGGDPDYDYVRRVLSEVTNRFTYSRLILEKDYYQAVLGKEN